MKKIILTIVAILSLFISKAQSSIDTTQLLDIIGSVDYIFEGQVTQKCCYLDSSTGLIYTSNMVHITKIGKGDITCGTVQVITEGGTLDNRTLSVSHNTEFNVGYAGVFICSKSSYPHSNNCERGDNPQELKLALTFDGLIDYYNDPFNTIARGYHLSFDQIQDLYDFLQVNANISLSICDSSFNPIDWEFNNKLAHKHPKHRTIPVITSINNSTANVYNTTGGTNTQITLKGYGFEDSVGHIYLRNADDGGESYLQINQFDICTWSDTNIVFVVPSLVDTNNFTPSGLSYLGKPAGSGLIGVENYLGEINDTSSTSTSKKLNIQYSVFNYKYASITVPYYRNNIYLFRDIANFQDSTYHFRFNTNITDPNMKNCIKAAFRRWTCMTGVNFVIDPTPIDTGALHDYRNIIMLANIDGPGKVLLKTNVSSAHCSGQPFSAGDIDILIDSSDVSCFQYDTTGTASIFPYNFDFFSLILHEVGHALCLNHVNDTTDIMYSAAILRNTTLPASQRIINFNINNQHGGDYTVQNSIDVAIHNFTGSCANYFLPMAIQPMNCRLGPLQVNQIVKKEIEASIYPNPFSNSINVVLPYDMGKLKFELFNSFGAIIHSEELFNSKTIFLPNLPNGMYYAKLSNGKNSLVKKIVCIN